MIYFKTLCKLHSKDVDFLLVKDPFYVVLNLVISDYLPGATHTSPVR